MPLRGRLSGRAGRGGARQLAGFEPLRRRVAEKVGAGGTDAYSLLAAVKRDCRRGTKRHPYVRNGHPFITVTYVSGPDIGDLVAEEGFEPPTQSL